MGLKHHCDEVFFSKFLCDRHRGSVIHFDPCIEYSCYRAATLTTEPQVQVQMACTVCKMHRGEHQAYRHGKRLPWYAKTTYIKPKSIIYAHVRLNHKVCTLITRAKCFPKRTEMSANSHVWRLRLHCLYSTRPWAELFDFWFLQGDSAYHRKPLPWRWCLFRLGR